MPAAPFLATIDLRLHFQRIDVAFQHCIHELLLWYATKLVIVDELSDRAVFTPQLRLAAIGHSGFLRSFNSRKRIASASYSIRRPTRGSPMPRISLTASVATIDLRFHFQRIDVAFQHCIHGLLLRYATE